MNDETTIHGSSLTGQGADDTQEGALADLPIEKGSSVLGLYDVLTDAICGGMGRVFKVHHSEWGIDLALKQPHAHLFKTEGQKETFIGECDAWINLGLHPHIVSCYYVRRVEGTPSIFSEWMEGGSLADWMLDSGGEPARLYQGEEGEQVERILDIAIQYARGLHYAHECGLIHQDVKPDNVLLTAEGVAKVADFGIAQARALIAARDGDAPQPGAPGATMMSESGAYTPAYCSMEQLNGLPLTRRTDIYSWAVTLLEMLLHDRPWPNGVVAGAGLEDYFDMVGFPLPESLKDLLRTCLKQDEADRMRDFALIEDRLIAIYGEMTGHPYTRSASKAASDTADSLNNRALSYLDLGLGDRAEELWEQALHASPMHLESTYNLHLHLWRSCRIDDLAVLRHMEACLDPASWKGNYLIYLLHLERNDARRAKYYRREAIRLADGDEDALRRIDQVEPVYEALTPEHAFPERKAKNLDLGDFDMEDSDRLALAGDTDPDLDGFDDDAVMCVDFCAEVKGTRFVLLTGSILEAGKLYDGKTGRIIRSERLEEGDDISMARVSGDRTRLMLEHMKGAVTIIALPSNEWLAGWELCTVKATGETLEQERLLAEQFEKAREHCAADEFPAALAVMLEMRGSDGFEKTAEWSELFARITWRCRKTGFSDFYLAKTMNLGAKLLFARLEQEGRYIIAVTEQPHSAGEAEILVLDAFSGTCIRRYPAAPKMIVLAINGDSLYYYGDGGTVEVFDLEKRQDSPELDVLEFMEFLEDDMPSRSVSYVAESEYQYVVKSLPECEALFQIAGAFPDERMGIDRVRALTSDDERYTVMLDERDGDRLTVYDMVQQAEVHNYAVARGCVPSFSPGGCMLAVADEVCVKLFDPTRTGNFSDDPASKIFTGIDSAGSIAYTSDGRFLIAQHVGTSALTMQVYDADASVVVGSKSVAAAYAMEPVCLSYDDRFAITCDREKGVICRWEFDWDYECIR